MESSFPKETYYFLDLEHPLLRKSRNVHQSGVAGFLHFFNPHSSHKMLLEGTPHLFYQQQMPVFFQQHLPNSRIIFILREPAERIRSSFEFTQNNLANFRQPFTFHDYTQALLKDDTEAIIHALRDKNSRYVLPKELNISTYHQHLSRWFTHFDKEQILMVQFEQLLQQPQDVLHRIFDWLELPPVPIDTAAKRNTSYTIRYKNFHFYLRQLANALPASGVKSALKNVYFQLLRQPKVQHKDTSVQTAMEQLRTYFQTHNEKLAAMTSIDLKYWKS